LECRPQKKIQNYCHWGFKEKRENYGCFRSKICPGVWRGLLKTPNVKIGNGDAVKIALGKKKTVPLAASRSGRLDMRREKVKSKRETDEGPEN